MDAVIHGIIVTYHCGRGSVLLLRRTDMSLDQLVADYAQSRVDKGYWFARFDWSVIASADKEYLKGKKKKLIGRRIICKVTKDPKWRATWLSVDLEQQRVALPERYNYAALSRPPKRHNSSRPFQEAPKVNNLGRPWGGMMY